MNLFRARKKKHVATAQAVDRNVYLELHEKLEEMHLVEIKEEFLYEEGKHLDEEQLKEVLFLIADVKYTDQEFRTIFTRMCKHSNKFVTWDEFISYLILGYEQKEVNPEYQSLLPPIPNEPKMITSSHRHPINRIALYPTLNIDKTISERGGNILTCSKDGVINFWSIHMQLERTVQSTCPELKFQTTWVTDMAILPDVSVVCTSSTERDLRFYDTSARKFQLRVMFTSLEYAVCSMFYYFNEDPNKSSKLLLGNMDGDVIVIFINTVARGPFKSKPGDPLLSVRYERVVKDLVPGFNVLEFKKVHTDFVRQLMYYQPLHGVLSCSQCCKIAMQLTDLTVSRDQTVFKVFGGIWCFALEEISHMIATGSPDCLVRIWNPFVPSRPTSVLYGHHTGIVQLVFQNYGKLLYSLSKDKCIKVWDVTTQHCLQSFFGLTTEWTEKLPLTALYIAAKRQWIIGSAMIAVVPLCPQPNPDHTDGNTHCEGISCVLYNKLFQVVVTCGLDSYIIVWKPWDGRRMLVIKDAHTRILFGEKVPVEITAATFDPGEIRLATAASDGSLKIWNFNNGTCIRNLQVNTFNEIKSVLWMKNRILACGWNKCITEFTDFGEVVASTGVYGKNWEQLHEEDITAAVVRVPQTLATCSFNGELIFWRLETGQPYKKFFVYDPNVRIKIQYTAAVVKERFDITNPALRQSVFLQDLKRKMVHSEQHTFKSSALMGLKQKFTPMDSEDTIKFRQIAQNCMLFLCTRPMEPKVGTLLVALENGFVQVWSHDTHGGFITSFNAVHKIGDCVVCMATDENNEFLFTGTRDGYIKTWLMKNYCIPETEVIVLPKYRLMFPFMWGDRFKGMAITKVKNQPFPILLNSFKAHLKSVNSLTYLDKNQIIVSCSADSSCRMWTLGGRFLQTIGTFKPWKNLVANEPVGDSFEFTVPSDMKRSLSSTSLRVFNGGFIARKLTFKQLQAQQKKRAMYIDSNKIYGKSLKDPILGNFFQIPKRTTSSSQIDLDTSFPYIPVYQHLLMPPRHDIEIPHTPVISLENIDDIEEDVEVENNK